MMMQDDKRDILRRHREDIAKSLHDINSVVSKLTDYKIITQNMEEEILCKSTRIQKCRELLNMLPRRGDSAFDMFFKVLIECDELIAAKFLEGIGGIIKEHQLPLVFPDPNDDSKIVNVQKCLPNNGSRMYEIYKRSMNDHNSEYYQMQSNPRGICVVINNEIFEKGTDLDNRPGTEKDVESLEKLFKQLHFKLEVHHNQKAQQIKDLVKQYKEFNHSLYDCFVLVILSHGSHGNIYGVDGKEVLIKEIVFSFDSIECPELSGKPKLFFIQACQGGVNDPGSQNSHKMTDEEIKEIDEITQTMDNLDLHASTGEQRDARVSNTTRRADMLIAMATSPGFVSWRNINIGTWFIQAVVYAFKYWAHSQELVLLMTKVNNLVQKAETSEDRNKQCPEWRSSLGKSLYFFPGLTQQETQPNNSLPPNQQQPMDQSTNSTTLPNPGSKH